MERCNTKIILQILILKGRSDIIPSGLLPLLSDKKNRAVWQFFEKGSVKMGLKNYYIILGISPDSSAEGVRGAFRRLAKKFHPDKAGRERTAFFQDITEAYEVLSDPEKRKFYNQKLTEENKRQKTIPIRQTPNHYKKRATHFKPNALEMDVLLTGQEAFSGVTLNLRLSIPVQCRGCEGTGRDFFFICIRCRGSGFTNMKRPLNINLPSRLNHGDIIKTTVALSEENDLHLLIQVYII